MGHTSSKQKKISLTPLNWYHFNSILTNQKGIAVIFFFEEFYGQRGTNKCFGLVWTESQSAIAGFVYSVA